MTAEPAVERVRASWEDERVIATAADGYLHYMDLAVRVDGNFVPLVDYLRDMEARIIEALKPT